MVISKAQPKKIDENPLIDIDFLIDKGAKVKADAEFELAEFKRKEEEKAAKDKEKAEERKAKDKEKWFHVNLRVDHISLKKIDEYRKNRTGCTRNFWIHEAIQEKLKRSEKE